MNIKKKKFFKYNNLFITIFLCILTSIPVYYVRITTPVDSDYGVHVKLAQNILDSGVIELATTSHPILHIIIISVTKLTGGLIGLYASLFILQLVVQGMIGAAVYYWIGDGTKKHWELWRVFSSVSVTLLAPFMILALEDGLFYFGYIGLANYHNPTIHLLKPFALGCLILAEKGLNRNSNNSLLIILSATFIILSAGIKPNFALTFLPALGIVFLYLLITKQEFDKNMIIWGFAVPSLLVLTIQYFGLYGNKDTNIAIIWAPFIVKKAFSDFLFIKFLLSSLFVLQGLVVFRHQLLTDRILLLGWIMFSIGIFQTYFLAESGERMLHANFGWSGQIALFLLIVIILRKSLIFYFTDKIQSNLEKLAGLITYSMHLAGGIAYYLYCLFSIHYR
jgi:hydrogenase-4 membrane subunit HyfE